MKSRQLRQEFLLMGATRMVSVMHLLRQLVSRHPPTAVSDAQLLHRYTELDDETAFAALLHRHGPMVFGLCCRLLGNETDADDVFQATFLVLIRRAESIRRRRSVGSWLHGVALRLARRVRSDAARRQRLESTHIRRSTSSTIDADVRPIIDEELEKLHENYRAPLVLCYLEGKTYDEAASQLGVSLTTVCGRLARARNLLHSRLTRRGLAPAVSMAALSLTSQQLLAAVSPTLAASTSRLALLWTTAKAVTTTGVSASVADLVEGMMKTVVVSKMKVATAVILSVGVIGTGAGVLARQAMVKPEAERTAESTLEFQERPAANAGRVDLYGDPLPAEAVARLGTVRFRHGGLIQSVRYTPDGKKIVTYGHDGVRIWEAASGKELHSLPKESAIYGASLSSDGKLLASASGSGLFIWDVASATLVRSKTDHRYTSVNFSIDDTKLLVSSVDNANEIRIGMLDATTFQHVWSVVGVYRGYSLPECFAYTTDGKFVIHSHYVSRDEPDRMLLILEAQTGREVRKTKLGDSMPFKMACSPDGKLLAVLCRKSGGEGYSDELEHYVRVLELASGKEKLTLHPPHEEDPTRQKVYSTAVFTPDSRSLITSGSSDALVVWDAATGKEQRRLGRNLSNSRDMTFSPDGKLLAVAGHNDIRVISFDDSTDIVPLDRSRWSLNYSHFTEDGKTAITGNDQLIVFWDAVTGKELRRQELKPQSPVDHLSGISNDGAFAYRANHVDKTVCIRDLITGRESEAIKLDSEARYADWLTCISPDNKVVALTSQLQTRIQLRDSRSSELLKELTDSGMQVRGLHFTADGRTLVACCQDLTMRVFDVVSGDKLRQVGPVRQRGEREDARFLKSGGIHEKSALSPDGKIVATGSPELCLVFFDAITGNEVRRSDPLLNLIGELTFSPDGRLVACHEFNDLVINLFEVQTAEVRHSLRGHRGKCNVLSFSADGKRLISGSNDTTAVIWDLTGQIGASGDWGTPLSVAALEGYWSDLASDDAATAYQAIRRLAATPASAVPYLAKQLPSEIAKRNGNQLRSVRAIETLEFAGTPAARAVLERIATGFHTVKLTQDAKESLERLRKRS